LLVHSGDHDLLLKDAHRALIPATEETQNAESVFGASWRQIQQVADQAQSPQIMWGRSQFPE
jgi:hypothetical protein